MSGSTSKRYPIELHERAVQMVAGIRADHESEWAAMSKVAELLGVGTTKEPAGRAARSTHPNPDSQIRHYLGDRRCRNQSRRKLAKRGLGSEILSFDPGHVVVETVA